MTYIFVHIFLFATTLDYFPMLAYVTKKSVDTFIPVSMSNTDKDCFRFNLLMRSRTNRRVSFPTTNPHKITINSSRGMKGNCTNLLQIENNCQQLKHFLSLRVVDLPHSLEYASHLPVALLASTNSI